MESNEMSLSKLQADTLYSLIYIKLQEFLRNKHVEKEKEDHRSKFIKDFVRTDEKYVLFFSLISMLCTDGSRSQEKR
jgi:hypothetical protein